MLLVTQTNPGEVWKDTAQRCDYKEAGTTGDPLGGWLPPVPSRIESQVLKGKIN